MMEERVPGISNGSQFSGTIFSHGDEEEFSFRVDPAADQPAHAIHVAPMLFSQVTHFMVFLRVLGVRGTYERAIQEF
jgi:hypothetical protein